MAILDSNSLLIAMWILFVAIIVLNTLVLILCLPKRRETGINKLMIYLTMGSNYFTAAFILIILSMDSGKSDFGDAKKKRFQLLCNLAGYFGIGSLQISLWSLLIAALNLLLGLLFPRKFKRGKNYVFVVRTIVLGELTLLLPLSSIPFLPISQFTPAQRNTWDSLCLPVHSSDEPFWEFSAFWFLVSTVAVATLVITFGLLICYLKRQKHEAANAIPMQARLIKKKSSQVKRMSCLMMSTALCWIPALSVCVVTFAGHYISTCVMQWVFGFVLPLSAAVGPLCYIINTGLSGSTMENCLDICCAKAEKQGNNLRVRMGQLRGDTANASSSKGDPKHPQGVKTKGQRATRGRHVASSSKQNGTSRSHRSIPSRSLRSGRSKSGHCSRSRNAPRGAMWVQSVTLSGRNMKESFGVVEWQACNGSPRKGLMKLFMKGHFQQWKTESTILAKLNALERHPNIVDYLWHSKSSHTRLDRGHHENIHLRRRTTVERYICTSYYHHGTLRDFLINYSVKLQDGYIHAVATQIASGLAYLHSNNIIHNFLESTNILVGGHPENMTLKAVIANFTEAYDLTRDMPATPTPPTTPNGPAKIDDISTSWVDKFSTSVARATIHDSVLAGASESQMYASDVRSFALIMLEMLTWLRQMGTVAKGRTQEVNNRHQQQVGIDDSAAMDRNQVQMHADEDQNQSPVPFIRNIANNPRKPRSRREQALLREQQQHINVVCESLPEDDNESNMLPGRKSSGNESNMPDKQAQTKSALLRIIHQKQDSTCSTDSGVSSQPSSKAMSCHSSSSGSSDKTPRFNKTKDDHCSDVEFDATTEMWVESHAEESSGYRPCIMEHGLKSKTHVSNTSQENEMQNVDYSNDISCDETQEANSREFLSEDGNGAIPRSGSSLSQFYIRKRTARPHSFSATRTTATLPHNLNKQEMDLLTARANVNATLRPKTCYNSSDMLDNVRQRSATPIPVPLQRHPGSAMPTAMTGSFPAFLPGLIIPQRSATPPLPEPEQQFATIRRTRSRKRSTTPTPTPTPFSTQQQPMNITTNPKHLINHRLPGQGQYPAASNVQFAQETIPSTREDTPMLKQKPHWDSSCPSGVGEQHLGYCQELQTLFPHQLCSDGCVLEQEVECGRAMAEWMVTLHKMDGYMPKQLVHILDVCWSNEPAQPSATVYRMLDNCLTEVAL